MNDAALMRLVCEGNHNAFAELVKRHTQRYFALAFRTLQNHGDAEDVVQSAFIKLWQKPTSWNANKSRFTTWFYRVVLNACHDHRRKQARFVDIEIDALLTPTSSELHLFENRQEEDWRQHCLEFAIGKLPTSQRDALNLVVYSSLPQRQAAQIMGISLKALESLLSRAKRALAITVAQLSEELNSADKQSDSQKSA